MDLTLKEISSSFPSLLDTTRHFLYFVTVFSDLLFLRFFNATKNQLNLTYCFFVKMNLTVFLSGFAEAKKELRGLTIIVPKLDLLSNCFVLRQKNNA